MVKRYLFEGYSDDIIGEYGITNIEHDDFGEQSTREFTVVRPNGEGVSITGVYCDNGVWNIGMALIDAEKPLNADWYIYFEPNEEAAYRNRLVVVAPDDARLRCLNSGESEK